MRKTLIPLLLSLLVPGAQATQTTIPTFDQIIELKRPGSVALSPDGSRVAYTVSEANWEENAYETEIFLADASGGEPIQLTRAKKSSTAPAWSPDGTWLAFGSDRTDKRQLYLIHPAGGEAKVLTNVEEGVGSFEWSPDGTKIAFTMSDPKPDAAKERDKKYGEFVVIDDEYRMTHLHVVDVDPTATEPAKPKRLTNGNFTVGSFEWSPDGKSIAFDHRIDPNLNNTHTGDISVLTLGEGSIRKLVTQDGPDGSPVWSPDGRYIAFQSAMANPSFYYTNQRIAVVPAAGGQVKAVSLTFDEQPGIIGWAADGIHFSGLERTSSRLYRLDPATGRHTTLTTTDGAAMGGFSFSRDFSTVAFTSGDAKSFPELYVAEVSAL
ncbi:hypothetical protein BH24ACI5_BH24ACI5_25720 [soil metagenome]